MQEKLERKQFSVLIFFLLEKPKMTDSPGQNLEIATIVKHLNH